MLSGAACSGVLKRLIIDLETASRANVALSFLASSSYHANVTHDPPEWAAVFELI